MYQCSIFKGRIMIRLSFVAILVLVCSCVSKEPLPTYQTKFEKVNVAGIEVVPASQTSQLWVSMPENDVYKVLGSPSGQMGSAVLLFDLYDPKFSDRTVPHYVVLNRHGNVKYWGSSGSPDKAIDVGEFGY
jgi:hypothetical protein